MSAEALVPRERPVIFSARSVRAILDGRKTQTRRLVKGQALELLAPGMFVPDYVANPGNYFSRLGQAGDRLWVRETWRAEERDFRGEFLWGIRFKADDNYQRLNGTGEAVEGWLKAYSSRYSERWRPSIFLPRWASRIQLEVRSVRIERLRAISAADSFAEGVVEFPDAPPSRRYGIDPHAGGTVGTEVAAYATAWESIHGRGSWRLDPWVWVVEFARISP